MKAETHNSPSALDPYGGAMTGIVGVNRDILGTGLGARPIANTDVFCFGPPDYSGNIPTGYSTLLVFSEVCTLELERVETNQEFQLSTERLSLTKDISENHSFTAAQSV